MSVAYSFTDAQISDLEKSLAVFNRFTGQRLTLQKYIHQIVVETIKANTEASKQAQFWLDNPKAFTGKEKISLDLSINAQVH